MNAWVQGGGENITAVWVNMTYNGWDADVFDVDDNDAILTNDIPGGSVDYTGVGGQNTTTSNYQWNFDTLKTSGLGYDEENYFELRLTYERDISNQGLPYNASRITSISTTFKVYIYFSSAFDNPAITNDDAPLGVLPRLRETTANDSDPQFEAGDTFTKTQLTLNNYDPDSGITDVNCTITPPAGGKIKFTNNKNTCIIPLGVAMADTNELNYRMDIAVQTPPGIYEGTADITYTRVDSGFEITELDHIVEWEVDFSFRDNDTYTPATDDDSSWSPFQCQATSVVILNDTRQIDYEAEYEVPQIEQSTYTDQVIRVNVTVHNNGNTPIYNVQFAVAPGSDFYPAPGAGWDFFRNPRFFWASVGAPANQYDSISQTFAQINVNQTITLTIEMIVSANIPIGVHRLPLAYDGYYFNDGSIEEATGFFEINGGDGTVTQDDTDALNVIFAIEVVDEIIACHVTKVGAVGTNFGDKGDIRAETLYVLIQNDELYGFIDVIVRANFTGTPWYMPVINMRSPWVEATNANSAVPYSAWPAEYELNASFTVDTDSTMTPDRYPFQLEITAVIEATLEVVTVIIDYSQGTVYDFAGYGPEISITAFTGDEEIVPGQGFSLALTVMNSGDDSLRDVWVSIPADDTEEYEWDFESEFKDQFNWEGVFDDWGAGDVGTVTWENSEFPSEMFYTMESLDVDNIKEIVEINLYADGVFSDPGARIELIHIIDLAPGASFDVTFDMFADKDMVNGKPYSFDVTINGLGPDGSDRLNYYRTIQVSSSLPGDTYNPVELNWFDAGLKALALFLFFIIVLAILLFVYNMFKGDSYDEDEEDFDFEDEEPFEPTPVAPAKRESEELVEP